MMKNPESNLLEIKKLTKTFPGVTALDEVDFTIKRNDIHVLVGENGAGKSTLVNIITGAYTPDNYEIYKFNGKDIRISNPKDSVAAGIAAVQQHLSLVPDMTIAENVFLNHEVVKRFGIVDKKRMNSRASKLIGELGVKLDPRMPVKYLNTSDRQVVEICKALALEPQLLLMDEPTSGLNINEISKLFDIIKKLQAKGMTILYISHRLEEIFSIGEYVTILRDGKKIKDAKLADMTIEELTSDITGKENLDRFPKESIELGDVTFQVKNLWNHKSKVILKDISFSVNKGEILGFYGILGSGKEELVQTIYGLTPSSSGDIFIDGDKVDISNPQKAINRSLGYLTEDRSNNGYVPFMSVAKNQTMASLKNYCSFDFINHKKEADVSKKYIKMLNIKTPHHETFILNLSGGNQQKVLFSRWLISNSKILLLSEPTRGIDIGAKREMFKLMVNQAQKGAVVLFFSSELDEIFGMSDRILVMRNGKIIKECKRNTVTKAELLAYATKSEFSKGDNK